MKPNRKGITNMTRLAAEFGKAAAKVAFKAVKKAAALTLIELMDSLTVMVAKHADLQGHGPAAQSFNRLGQRAAASGDKDLQAYIVKVGHMAASRAAAPQAKAMALH